MTLNFYFAKQFFGAFLRVFTVLTLLVFVIETLENIRGLSKSGVDFGQSAILAVFSSPTLVLQAMPIIVMLSGLTFCVGLARSNEFVVTRAIGMAALRAMVSPAISAFILGLATILFLNPLSALFMIYHDQLKDSYTDVSRGAVSFGDDGFWLRQKDEEGHTVIHAQSANSRGTSLREATALKFDKSGQLMKRIFSRTAILREKEWVFTNGKVWSTGRRWVNPEQRAETFEILRFATDITPAQILDGYPKPEAVPIWDKISTIESIGAAGFSTLPHWIHLNTELAQPLMLMAMMIIGAAFTLQTPRVGNRGVSVFISLVCGFSLYFVQNLAITLGEAGEIPVFAAAWAPPLAALLFAVGLFLRFEDG